jgi:huntingtin
MKLYETLKGSYEAEVVTLDTNKLSSKFGDIVRSSLEVLAVVVEHQGVPFQSYAEEALSYMQVVIIPEPRAVLLCVQQLLVVLFGKAPPNGSADDQTNPSSTSWSELVRTNDSFFDRCITPSRPAAAERALAKELKRLSVTQSSMDPDEVRRKNSRSSSDASSNSQSRSRTSSTPPPKEGAKRTSAGGQEEMDKPTMFGFIQLFEPLVIRAMNLYTTTSSIPLQQQILLLLCRLLTLRVNYNMLDGNMVFIKAVLKQLELIENGHIRNAHLLLSHLFQFLTLLIPEQSKLGGLLSMPRIIQLVDGLLASIHLPPRLFLPSLQPIVRELFIKSSARHQLRPQKEDELSALREVVINMLLKHLKHPPVWEQLDLLLTVFKDDEEKLKPLSRKIVDGLLPLLSSGTCSSLHISTLSGTVLFPPYQHVGRYGALPSLSARWPASRSSLLLRQNCSCSKM